MNATNTERVIGLWLDTTDGESWIVSRDDMNPDGTMAVTRTLDTFEGSDFDGAKDSAIDSGARECLRVIKTDRDQSQECIYDPRKAHAYAVAHQGFEGDFDAWMVASGDDRAEYEHGAAGFATH